LEVKTLITALTPVLSHFVGKGGSKASERELEIEATAEKSFDTPR
jgi:hypothetical protein